MKINTKNAKKENKIKQIQALSNFTTVEEWYNFISLYHELADEHYEKYGQILTFTYIPPKSDNEYTRLLYQQYKVLAQVDQDLSFAKDLYDELKEIKKATNDKKLRKLIFARIQLCRIEKIIHLRMRRKYLKFVKIKFEGFGKVIINELAKMIKNEKKKTGQNIHTLVARYNGLVDTEALIKCV